MVYAERRNALVKTIANDFGSELQVVGAEAGMHLAKRRVIVRSQNTRPAKIFWLWPLSPG